MVPTEEVLEIKEGQKKRTERKYFPGYVMIKMDLNDDSWMFIKQSNGVIDFLGGSKPSSLTDIEVENLQKD